MKASSFYILKSPLSALLILSVLNLECNTHAQSPSESVLPLPTQGVNQPTASTPQTSTATPRGTRIVFRATAFSNMELGWQITNPGTRYLLKSNSTPVVGGEIVMADAVAAKKMAPSNGAVSPMIELTPSAKFTNDGFFAQNAEGSKHKGVMSICLAQDPKASQFDTLTCRSLTPNVPREHDDRNHQFINAPVTFVIEGRSVRIVSWDMSRDQIGREGTAEAPSMTVYHPVYQAQTPGKSTKDNRSPLVLDMDYSGKLDLVGIWDKNVDIQFDLEGDGQANRTGWVKPQDALLAIDRNGDGIINDGRELFGDYSWAYDLDGSVAKRFPNGFAALAQYDSNQDGSIDSSDPGFKFMLLWHDRNQDGQSNSNELLPVAGYVQSIKLAYVRNTVANRYVVQAGNEVRFVSTFVGRNGAQGQIADVYFAQARN